MDLLGIAISIFFVLFVIALSTLLTKKSFLGDEGARKFIHIGVSNWWILAIFFFTNRWTASVVPAVFVIVNFISYRKNLFKAMEREDVSRSDLGTVYYAISLVLLSLITWEISPLIGLGAILTMGYGDGFAAVIGSRAGRGRFLVFGQKKSLTGSLVMFLASFIVAFITIRVGTGDFSLLWALLAALTGTILELLSPWGTDNLTVPLGTAVIFYFIFI